jgi:tight adherence protein B
MEFDPIMLAIAGAAVTAGLCVFALATTSGDKDRKAFKNRLARVAGDKSVVKTSAGSVASIRTTDNDSGIKFLDTLVKRYLPRPALLRKRLECTGMRISAGEYVLFSLVIMIFIGFISSQFLGRSVTIAVLAGISSGLTLPHLMVKYLISRRLNAFTAEFPQAIDLIVRGLKSGLPVPASMRAVAEEIKDPVGKEFAIISDRLKIGQTLDEALHNTTERIPTPEFNFFVTSLAVQRETGGNLGETLENLSNVLRDRRKMKQKIKAMSSEATASAMILGSLPFLMFGIMMLLNPTYVGILFTDPRGTVMLGFAILCLTIGVAVMAKMVWFEI